MTYDCIGGEHDHETFCMGLGSVREVVQQQAARGDVTGTIAPLVVHRPSSVVEGRGREAEAGGSSAVDIQDARRAPD